MRTSGQLPKGFEDGVDSTTLAGEVGVPAKDKTGKRRSIPYLLDAAGLVNKQRRLTEEGKKFGAEIQVNGSRRLYWKLDEAAAALRFWLLLNDW